jgi:hypothetical protein
MRQSYELCGIFFAGRTTFDFRPNIATSYAKPYVAAPGVDLAGKPMGAQA